MKKILLIICFVLAICTFTFVVACAEEAPDAVAPEIDESTNETIIPDTSTPVVEMAAEKTVTESIADWFKNNLGYISVIATSLLIAFYDRIVRGRLSKTLGTVNNNSIAIAHNSAETINTALLKVENFSNSVESIKKDFASLLDEVRKTAEEKQSLETTLIHVETFLKSSKLATLELANEVAELLVLANIPVSKKDEFYARHTQAVHEIESVEEVMSHERKEA